MTNGDSQQRSLDTLKLINAASTALRLYPGDSAQVRNSTEKAYQGVKAFLRDYERLRFSCHNGVCSLGGTAVDKPTQERLQLLTFNDVMQKLDLRELVFARGFDRPTFKKILSVFSATPEQVQKVGGSRAFIAAQELQQVFPEKFVAPGESEEELARKKKVDEVLKELASGQVRLDDLHYLYGKKEGQKLKQQVAQKFETAKGASHLIATACYSLLQIMQKESQITATPAFTKMLERVDQTVQEVGQGKGQEYGQAAGALLAPKLDDSSAKVLLCQQFSSSFGSFFYDAVVRYADGNSLSRVCRWMTEQSASSDGSIKASVVTGALQRFQDTGRAKQLMAADKARRLLAETEEGRKTKRVQVGIEALAAGKMEGLRNKEVCASLPSTIQKLIQNDKESLAAAIIQNVVNGFKEEKNELRFAYGQVIGGVAEKLVVLKRWEWLEKLTPICLAWIRETEEISPSYKQYIQAMQDMMNHAWHSGNNSLAEHILNIFYYIRSGAFEKNDQLRSVVAKIQDENVDLALLQEYLDQCFVRPVNELICKKIAMQGPVAARFLLDTLISTDERSDRIRLLKLLAEVGDELVPVLLERLPDPMPWYGKRNIIRLLTETGTERDIPAVLSYITHEDLRVQQECLQCIVRLGKAKQGKYLLQVLSDVTLRMKIQIVKSLARVADSSVIGPLELLLDECRLYQGEEKQALVKEICRVLGASRTIKAIPVLEKIVTSSVKVFDKELHKAAAESIEMLKEMTKVRVRPKAPPLVVRKIRKKVNTQPQEEKEKKVEEEAVDIAKEGEEKKSAQPKQYKSVTGTAEEDEVYTLLAKDKLESAKKLLLDLIKKHAQKKQFSVAEALRLRLIDIDSMALADIIKAAECIEEAKSAGVDENHIIIWSELYDLLTTEEFNTMYHALEHEKYGLEDTIVRQGDLQWRLFFVNKGRVKLYYREKENEILVKTIGSGQIFGGESFFDDSVWTLNASSMGSVELSTLAIDHLRGFKDEYPALEPKIRDYCKKVSNEQEFFQSSGVNRRSDIRKKLSLPVSLDLLAEDGSSEIAVKGEGSDISRGGISFTSRISQRKHARTLLGRNVEVHIGEEDAQISFIGRVVAIRNLHSADLGRSVHVCFDKDIDDASLAKLSSPSSTS